MRGSEDPLSGASASSGPRKCRVCLRLAGGVLVGLASGALGYLVGALLGAESMCPTGQSPITFALIVGLTAGAAAYSGFGARSWG